MKKSLQSKVIILMIVLTGYVFTSQVWASSNVLFIFDVSERMSGKFPEHTKLKDLSKLDTATEALESMLENLPQDLHVGLEAYGHQGDKDCSAIEIVSPLQQLDTEEIINKLDLLESEQGSAPLAAALQLAGEELSSAQGNKSIVLFSDGKDSCGGDINEVISWLKAKDIAVYVLAIDVKEDEVAELFSIADENEEHYYSVNNVEDMKRSLDKIKEKIETKKTYEDFFRDDFVEKSLSKQWQVLNPDAKLMEVSKGSVTFAMATNKPKNAKNILRLTAPDSESDWVFTANLNVIPQSTREVFELGISNEAGSQVVLAQLNINSNGNLILKGIKGTKKSTSSFQEKLASNILRTPNQHSDFFKDRIRSITVKLEKIGMEYEVSAKLEPLDNSDKIVSSKWVTLKKINSSLLPNDKFFIKTYSMNVKNHQAKTKGELALKWVDVKIIK